ncbi:MAG: hypothetical protein RL685_1442, partial [Pseudomonadota bacterium]
DRTALPAPEFASEDENYVAPRTPVEEVLAGIWAEVLRLERVGVEESFFDLGGHSLLATRFLIRLEERLGLQLPIAEFFAHSTVAELAELCRAALPCQPAPPCPTVEPAAAGSAELEGLLSRMENMSEAEVLAALEAAGGLSEPGVEPEPSGRR